MVCKWIHVFLSVLLPVLVFGQTAPHLLLDSVMVIARDSIAHYHTPASTCVIRLPQAFVKSNGPGSVATMGMRGGNSQQTQVLWQGLPLNHPMLGVADLSLIPHEWIRVHTVLPLSHANQNASGGTINLSTPQTPSSIQLHGSIGSFQSMSHNLKIRLENHRWSTSTHLYTTSSNNDYSYLPYSGAPHKIKLKNSQYYQGQFLQDVHFYITPSLVLSANAWLGEYHRKIPPLTTQSKSLAQQSDQYTRWTVQLNHRNLKSDLKWVGGHFTDIIQYTDPLQGIEVQSNARMLQSDLDYTHRPSKKIGINFKSLIQQVQGRIQSYDGVQKEWRNMSKMTYFQYLRNIRWHIALMGIYREQEKYQLLPKASATWQHNGQQCSITIGQNFSWPALNDLHWQPGGNTNLQTTVTLDQEVEYILSKWSGTRISASVFHKITKNWIQWIQMDNGPLWRAENLGNVRAWGLQSNWEQTKHLGLLELGWVTGYEFTRSFSLSDIAHPKIERGQQWIYLPRHRASIDFFLKKNGYQGLLGYTYTSKVHGINADIKGYALLDLSLKKMIPFKEGISSCTIMIHNLFDQSYEVTERRPMPGRHYTIQYEIQID